MKQDNKTTTREATTQSVALPTPGADLETDLAAIAAEEAALNLRKTLRRQQYWDQAIASLSSNIHQLISHGFPRRSIGKALGFALPKSSTTSTKASTPSTTQDWLSIYRATGMRAYLKAHPEFAATLKTNKIKTAAYFDHLPPDDLQLLDQVARQKANLKHPSSTIPQVPA